MSIAKYFEMSAQLALPPHIMELLRQGFVEY